MCNLSIDYIQTIWWNKWLHHRIKIQLKLDNKPLFWNREEKFELFFIKSSNCPFASMRPWLISMTWSALWRKSKLWVERIRVLFLSSPLSELRTSWESKISTFLNIYIFNSFYNSTSFYYINQMIKTSTNLIIMIIF